MRRARDLATASRVRYGGSSWPSEIGPGSDSYRRENATHPRRHSYPRPSNCPTDNDRDELARVRNESPDEHRQIRDRDGFDVTKEDWS